MEVPVEDGADPNYWGSCMTDAPGNALEVAALKDGLSAIRGENEILEARFDSSLNQLRIGMDADAALWTKMTKRDVDVARIEALAAETGLPERNRIIGEIWQAVRDGRIHNQAPGRGHEVRH